MSIPDRDAVETVEKLLADRQKVARWLAALEAKQSETPPAVFQKVRDDYAGKLEKVQAKLVATSDTLHLAAADVAARLTDKEEVVARKRDERSEAELRYGVGEYSEKEWEKRRAKFDDEIAVVTGERDALLDELRRLRDVLAEVAGHGTQRDSSEATASDLGGTAVEGDESFAAEAYAAGASAPTADVDMSGLAASDEQAALADAIVPAPRTIPIHEQSIIAPVEPAQPLSPSFDELAFLKSVVGRPTPLATPIAAPHPMEPALVPKRPGGESKRGSGDSKRASAQTPTKPSKTVAEPPPDENEYALPEPPVAFPDPVPEPRVSQEMTPPRESFFGRPTPRTSEAVKSLRCQECGTLNFPTEWYCERCGGELAAF